MGGAYSVDRQWRVPFESWWPQEVPNDEMRAMAREKVAEVGSVDYVLTHCPPSGELRDLGLALGFEPLQDEYAEWLQAEVAEKLAFGRWFYGHMHVDRPWARPYTALYDAIFDLDDTGRTPYGPDCATEAAPGSGR